MQRFDIHSGNARLPVNFGSSSRLTNLGPGTVSYADSDEDTAQGTLAPAATVNLSEVRYLWADATATVRVEDLTVGTDAQRLEAVEERADALESNGGPAKLGAANTYTAAQTINADIISGITDAAADIYGFRYRADIEKTYSKGLFAADTGDTPDLAVRRKETTPLATDQPVANFYSQTWISGDAGGGWDPGAGSQSRGANIQFRTRGTQSSTNRGQAIGFHTCPQGDIYARDALLIEDTGELVVGLRSGGGKGITFEAGGPRVFRAAAGLVGVDGVEVRAPDTLTRPALKLRQSSDTTYGYDFDLESASVGRLDLHRVVAGTRTRVLSVDRGSGDVTFDAAVKIGNAWTASADVAINGYVTVVVAGTTRKLATIG